MNEPQYLLEPGTRIVTHASLGSTLGIIVRDQYLATRRPSTPAVLGNYVAGHGGDIYWAKHDDGTVAVYGWQEFELDPEEWLCTGRACFTSSRSAAQELARTRPDWAPSERIGFPDGEHHVDPIDRPLTTRRDGAVNDRGAPIVPADPLDDVIPRVRDELD